MNYPYKEIRKVDSTKLQALCIKYNWFTLGTNEQYGELLDYGFSQREISLNELVEMATLILNYSDTHYSITDIMYELNSECCYSYFVEC